MGRLGSQAAQFAASLVLARLLAPEQFGLIASAQVFSQFALLFFELGMGSALVQAKELRQDDLSTVFWINAVGGVVFAAMLAGAAPWIADFFHEPELRSLTPLVGLTFTVNLSVCHLALLQRSMRFRPIAVAEITSAAIGFTTSIACAAGGLGVYALALGPIVQQASYSVLLWSMVPWRPTGHVSRAAARRVWKFSGGLLGFNIVNYWGRNADNLIIGRTSGAAELGFYNRSYNFMLLPVQQISQVLGRVMLPALSRLQDDHTQACITYRRSLQTANLLAIPVLVGVAATAPALVPAVWGPRWVPMVPILTLLCIAGVPQCLTTSVGWLYQSQNRTARLFRMGVITSGLGIAGMIFGGVVGGTLGVAWAVVARTWLFSIPSLAYAGKLIGLKVGDVLRDNAPIAAISSAMAAVVWCVPSVAGLDRTGAVTLFVQVPVGMACVAVGLALVGRSQVAALASTLRRRG